jgi:hypothetical protein
MIVSQCRQSYAVYAKMRPDAVKIIAIAEPRVKTRESFASTYEVDKTLVFESWQELHAASAETLQTVGTRLADAVIVAVQDHMHKDVVLAFAAQASSPMTMLLHLFMTLIRDTTSFARNRWPLQSRTV